MSSSFKHHLFKQIRRVINFLEFLIAGFFRNFVNESSVLGSVKWLLVMIEVSLKPDVWNTLVWFQSWFLNLEFWGFWLLFIFKLLSRCLGKVKKLLHCCISLKSIWFDLFSKLFVFKLCIWSTSLNESNCHMFFD